MKPGALRGQVSHEVRLSATLTATTPLHVGGMAGDGTVDMVLARDGCGRPFIPGSSLAGALRAWMRGGAAEDAAIAGLWGSSERDAAASRITVYDAAVSAAGEPEVRARTGIDRHYGTVASGVLFDRELLPPGSTVQLDLRATATGSADACQLLARIVLLSRALADGEVSLGAVKTRGLGRVTLDPDTLQLEVGACTTPAWLLARLRGTAAELTAESMAGTIAGTPGAAPILRGTGVAALAGIEEALGFTTGLTRQDAGLPALAPVMEVIVDWRPVGPLMVRASEEGIGADALPLTERGETGMRRTVLPGSSIAGALRARAERIARTVLGLQPVAGAEREAGGFAKQVRDVPLVAALFGAAILPREEDDTSSPLGSSAVHVEDCHGPSIPTDLLTEVATSEKAAESKELNERLARAGFGIETHVAIDRWTGGAAGGALFSVLQHTSAGLWTPIRLQLNLDRLDRAAAAKGCGSSAAIALLLLVLDELASGTLPLGFSVNRGMGSVELKGLTIRNAPGAEGPITLQFDSPRQSILAAPEVAALRMSLLKAWGEWIASNRSPITASAVS